MSSLERIQQKIDKEGLEFVRFEFSDIYGISRTKIIPARHFKEKASNGLLISLVQWVIDGSESVSILDPVLGDALWRPDLSTFRILPWCVDTATIYVEPFKDGVPMSFYPRIIARRQIERLDSLGLSLLVAHEHEFCVVDQETRAPITQDFMGRATVRTYAHSDFLYQVMKDLYKVGIDVEMGETEHGPGQVEITYKPTFGIQAADNASLFKTTVKEIAQQHGYIASFMSQPYRGQVGNSAHLNHSLWDKDGKRNLFSDADNPAGLSEVCQQWMAGILHHSRAINLLMAPTTNCNKRFGVQSYINSEPSWGFDNRSCMLRVKTGTAGLYIENRCCAAGSNPYLTLAATIAAGIDGIERKLQLPPEITDGAFGDNNNKQESERTSSSFQDTMDAFKADDIINNAFGDEFCEVFFALKDYEMQQLKSDGGMCEEDVYKAERKIFFKYM